MQIEDITVRVIESSANGRPVNENSVLLSVEVTSKDGHVASIEQLMPKNDFESLFDLMMRSAIEQIKSHFKK
jgi:glycine cleavage system regulatory protein